MNFVELGVNENFDPLAINSEAAFTQARFYGKWHEALGRRVRRFVIKSADSPELFAQVIKFSLPFGQSFLYAPYGPILKLGPDQALINFAKENFARVAKDEKAIFLRFDNSFAVGAKARDVGASGYFQPREETVLDLTKSEEEILAGMEKDHRYSIKVAEKRGARVEFIESIADKFDEFYSLLSETSSRNGFGLLSRAYYKTIFESITENKNGFLAVASFEGELLAMNLIILHGNSAHYLLGSSTSKLRDKLPTYLLQWATIKHLKEKGVKNYNLGGVDAWESLAKYKKGFGGHDLNHGDMYDLVGQPLWYFLYKMRKMLSK